jgi:hypothetical protein
MGKPHPHSYPAEIDPAESHPDAEPTMIGCPRKRAENIDQDRAFRKRQLTPGHLIEEVVQVVDLRGRPDRMTDHVDLHFRMNDSPVLGGDFGPRPGGRIGPIDIAQGVEYPAVGVETFGDHGTGVYAEAVEAGSYPSGWPNVPVPNDSFVRCHPASLPDAPDRDLTDPVVWGTSWPDIMGTVKAQSDNGGGAPVEVPEDIIVRVHALCLALPEVTVRVDKSRVATRSTAWSFDIRRRSFCRLVAVTDPSGNPVPLVRLWADPFEHRALLAIGHPFFASRSGPDRIGVLLTDDTDWEEMRELLTDSYRVLAPKKLTALLD